ncbi:hypothetical protein SPURM210S_01930 [Streptomyces purpurascens]
MIAVLGLVVGVVAGLLSGLRFRRWSSLICRSLSCARYIDAVFGGLRAMLDGIFDDKVFVVSFLSNVVVAALIVFLGDKLGVGAQLSTGVVVVLGIRISPTPRRSAGTCSGREADERARRQARRGERRAAR